MKALVAYESRGGHTRKAAEAIAAAVRDLGGEAAIKPVRQVKAADVQDVDVLFVGAWVQGLIFIGVQAAGASEWGPTLPALNGKPVGVFCTYMFNPGFTMRSMSKLLESKGAVVQGKRAFHRSRPDSGADRFVRDVLAKASIKEGHR